MTVKDLKNRVDTVINGLEEKALEIAAIMAISGLSVVKNRSINDGIFIDGEDGNFGQYSTVELPSFFFIGKELNKAGTDYLKSHQTVTWSDFKEAQGRGSENVNLSYSNRMWTSLAIVKQGVFDGIAKSAIGTTDAEVEKYLPYLVKRYGNFITPTDAEKEELIKDATEELIRHIKSILFR
jgi:hypothetical protein